MKSLVQIVLAGCVLCAAPMAHAGDRCKRDALEQWYCASDPRGTAVVDPLGRVVCAPGDCVKQDKEGDGWLCSQQLQGKAVATPEGVVCDGGECRAPESTACKKI
jgi:hypothetical protein